VRVTVKLFAAYREMAGAAALPLDLPEGATVGDALGALESMHPAVAAAGYRPLAARNQVHARSDDVLNDGDEVAFFPPVSGG
jgi:sulfur-carrier protein